MTVANVDQLGTVLADPLGVVIAPGAAHNPRPGDRRPTVTGDLR
ncbi:hypothetical protein OG292_19310 [Streptomyces sp. NBC_01511]